MARTKRSTFFRVSNPLHKRHGKMDTRSGVSQTDKRKGHETHVKGRRTGKVRRGK